MSDRYNKLHDENGVKFYLTPCNPDINDCKYLILKVIEQAIREYVVYYNPANLHEKYIWYLAADFLYDDNYKFLWGKWELSPEQFMDIVDIDIHYIREETNKKITLTYGENNGQEKRNREFYYRELGDAGEDA